MMFALYFIVLLRITNVFGDRPKIVSPIGNIQLTYCEFKSYDLSKNYQDSIDGFDLKLQLLDSSLKPFADEDHGIFFNADTRTLFLVPRMKGSDKETKQFQLAIRAIDSKGDRVDDNFTVIFTGQLPEHSVRFKFIYVLLKEGSESPTIEDLFVFLEKMKKLWKTDRIWTYEFGTFKNYLTPITLIDCTLQSSTCPRKEIEDRKSAIFNSENIISETFKNSMKPEFDVKDAGNIDVKKLGSCISDVNAEPSATTSKFWEPNYIDYRIVVRVDIPNDVMTDEEDGDLYFLKFEFTSNKIPSYNMATDWIGIENPGYRSNKTMYIAVMDSTIKFIDTSFKDDIIHGMITMQATITDQGGKSFPNPMSFYFDKPVITVHSYTVEFTFSCYDITQYIYAQQIYTFWSTFKILFSEYSFRDPNRMYMRSYNINQRNGNNGSGVLRWGVYMKAGCNIEWINIIRTIIYKNGKSGELKTTFQDKLKPTFLIKTAVEILGGNCELEKPIVKEIFPNLILTYCGLFRYRIPEETFADSQDGSTRNLKLSLQLDERMENEVNPLYLDEDTQTIYAILLNDITYKETMNYKLIASDSTEQTTELKFQVKINGKPRNETSFEVNVKSSFQIESKTFNVDVMFFQKLEKYFAISGKDFRLLKREISNGYNVFFTNCSLRELPCDVVGIDAMMEKLESSGDINPLFVKALQPQFTFQYITTIKRDPCKTDKTPRIVNKIKDIIVSPCSTTIYQIPENTFVDEEQGNTRNLQLQVTDDPPLSKNSYIHFRESTQELIVVSEESQPSKELKLIASDINGGQVQLLINIKVQKHTAQPNHQVTMRFSQLTDNFSNFVQLFNSFRQKIKNFFGNQDQFDTVELRQTRVIAGSFSVNSQHEVIWSNCSLPRDTCARDQIEIMKTQLIGSSGTVNNNFKTFMADQFDIKEVKIEYIGNCAPKKPPTVQNEIPIQKVSFCGFLEYIVPANTFIDERDSSTRGLTLMLTFDNGDVVPPTNWVYLDTTNQKIVAVLSASDENRNINQIYTFKLRATNRDGLSAVTDFKVKIDGQRQDVSIVFRIGVFVDDITSTLVLKEIIEQLTLYYGNNLDSLYIHDKNIEEQTYIIEFTSCNAVYKPCDREFIKKILNLSKANGGPSISLTANTKQYQTFLFDEVLIGDICKPPSSKPKINKPIAPFSVSKCGTFTVAIPKDTFNDEEDGRNLQLFVMEVNGLTLSQENQWISINSDDYTFYGVITNDVAINAPKNGYQLVVRAQDSSKLFVDTNVTVSIESKTITPFYSFSLELLISGSKNDLELKIDVLRIIEKFEKEVHIISCSRNENVVKFVWTSCNLPTYCSKQAIEVLKARIFDDSGTVRKNFTELFTSSVTFKSITLNVDSKCNVPLEPPVPRLKEARIEMTICGGYYLAFHKDIFVDNQDGLIDNLKLSVLTESSKDINEEYYWISYDDATKTVSSYATLNQALQFNKDNANKKFYVIATDSTGLQAYIELYLTFKIPNDPKYFYTFAFQYTPYLRNLLSLAFDFAERIRNFNKDGSKAAVAYSQLSENSITYFNCSISYKPCDIAKLNELKNSYSNDGGIPTQSIVQSFGDGYKLNFITVSKSTPCGDKNYPPINIKEITTIYVYICDHKTLTIQSDIFYDYEDGSENLIYSLQSKNNLQFSQWLSFESSVRTMSYNGYASAMNTQPKGGFMFSLIATDSDGLSASTDINIQMQGPYSILEECAIEMLFEFNVDITSYTNWRIDQDLVINLSTFLQISDSEIGIVYGKIESKYIYRFRWSYCSAAYSNYDENSKSFQPDYKNFYYKVLVNIFQADRKISVAFHEFFLAIGHIKSIKEVKTVFTGRCSNFPPFVRQPAEINLYIQYGGYVSYTYTADLFEDFEDGSAYHLRMKMLTSSYNEVAIDHWIHVDVSTYTIFAVTDYIVRTSTATSFIFYLRGVDSGGKYADVKVVVRKNFTIVSFSPFNITYEIMLQNNYNMIYARQSSILINQIYSYFQLTSVHQVLVWWYYRSNGFPESRYITWSILSQSCKSTILDEVIKWKSLNKVPLTFSSSFGNFFSFNRLYYRTTCIDNPSPPIPSKTPLKPPNITFCNLYSYKIPENQFIDPTDIDLRNMEVKILDAAGETVDRSSWVQINQAELKIYAIAIRNIYRETTAFQFQLQVINSAGMRNAIKFELSLAGLPFTADCPISMKFRYKFESSSHVDLDILWQVVNKISSFYEDKVMSIKVLEFYRMSSWYYIKWSNCSSAFQFSTAKQSHVGMKEEQRQIILSVFSKVTQQNKITARFQNYMSAEYEIEYVTASYCCIEKPPVAMKDKFQTFASFCRSYKVSIDKESFNDECDGNLENLKLSLHYPSGTEVNINEWVQLNKEERFIYGVVTELISANEPTNGFNYLIAATDYSGRRTTIPYNIRIADTKRSFQVYFVTGFKNNYPSNTPAVFILYRLQEATGKIINSNSINNNVYIKTFRYPKEIVWSYCKLDPCNKDDVVKVLEAVQHILYASEPSKSLITELSPNIQPFYCMVNMFDRRCANGEVNIIVDELPIFEIPTCGNFTLNLPQNLFQGSDGRSNRNLYIYATDSDGSPLARNFWIQFDKSLQHFHGIAVIDRISKINNLFLQAIHPISGKRASTSVQIQFSNFLVFKNRAVSYCQISTTVESRYQSAYEEITVIRIFIQMLSKYLQKLSSDIQILSYTQSNDIHRKLVIYWTDCASVLTLNTEKNSKKYFSLLNEILSLIFTNYQDTNSISTSSAMKSFFASNSLFTVVSNSLGESCFSPPNTPPIPKSSSYTITIPRCGYFITTLPNDLFTDEQDGNTRNLKLSMKYNQQPISKTSWIILKDYSIYTLPENKTLKEYKLSEGYRFDLMATDKDGLSATIDLIVKITDSAIYLPAAVKLIITGNNKIDSSFTLIDKISILRNVAKISELSESMLFMADGTDFLMTSFQAVVSYCDRCDTNIYQLNAISNDDLIDSLNPSFEVTIQRQAIFNNCDQVLNEYNPVFRNVEYCKREIYDIGTEYSLSNFPNVKAIFRDGSEDILQQQSMAWYNEENYYIEFFPKESDFFNSKTNHFNYTLWFQENGKAFGTKNYIMVTLNERNQSLEYIVYSMTFRSGLDVKNIDNYFISKVIPLIQRYVKEYEVVFYNFRRLQINPFTFTLEWKICFSKSDVLRCDREEKKILDNLFYDNLGNIKNEFIQLFSPQFELQSMLSNCENVKPKANKNITIELPVCGVLYYPLPNDAASDKEDGGLKNLSLELRNTDALLLPRDSYIEVDNANKSIIAVTSEMVLDSIKDTKEIFYLRYYDQNGAFAETILTALKSKDVTHTSYFDIKFIFSSSYPLSTRYVTLKYHFLKKLSIYSGDKNMMYYHVESFIKETSGESYRMVIGNCTVTPIICPTKVQYLANLEKKLITNGVNNELKNYFLPEFTINKVQIEKFFTIDTKPILKTVVDTIQLKSCCEMKEISFTADHISDTETEFSKLKFTIVGGNNSSNNYLFEVIDGDVTFIPISPLQQGSTAFSLDVTDSCQNTLKIPITVEMLQKCTTDYGYLITFEVQKQYPATYTIRLLKSTIAAYLGSNPDQLSITYFKEHNSKYEITLANCTINYDRCDKSSIQLLSSRLVKDNNATIEYQKFIQNLLKFVKVSEKFSEKCSQNSTEPPKSKHKSLNFNKTFCSEIEIQLDEDLFYDDKGKTSRDYRLQLLSSDSKTLEINEWIYLDENDVKLIGYPIASSYNPIRTFKYILRSYASNEVFTDVEIIIYIEGEVTRLNYQLILSAKINGEYSSPDPVYSVKLMTYLKSKFNQGNLNLIDFKRDDVFRNDIKLKFSFCKIVTELCDCIFIKKTQKSINENQILNYPENDFTFQELTYQLSEECLNNESPRIENSAISFIETSVGQYFDRSFPEDTFVDREDGSTQNLTLSLLNENSESMKSTEWIKLNDNSICGVLPVLRFQRENFEKTVEYTIQATDACGLSAHDNFNVDFQYSDIETDKYYILFMNVPYDEFASNCSDIELLIATISEYIGINKDIIYILDMYPYRNITNGTAIKWVVKERTIRLCDDSSKNITEKIIGITENFALFDKLKAVGFEAQDISIACPVIDPTTTTEKPPTATPFPWIIYLFIALLLLILLLFFLWLLIPRCCYNCCKSGLCKECCSRGGQLSSKSEDPEVGGIIGPTYVDSPPQSPETKPVTENSYGRRISTASQTDLLPTVVDDKSSSGRNGSIDHRDSAHHQYSHSTEKKYSSNARENGASYAQYGHYDHANINGNKYNRSETDGRGATNFSNNKWAVESWKDPRLGVTVTKDRLYRDGSRHDISSRNRKEIEYSKANKENTRYKSRRDRFYVDRLSRGYSDSSSDRGHIYEGDIVDPETITLTLPRNVIEEYLERRFQKTKGRSHQHKDSHRRTTRSTGRLADALVDDTISNGRKYRGKKGERQIIGKRNYLTSGSSTTAPGIGRVGKREPYHYFTSDANEVFSSDGSWPEFTSYTNNKRGYSKRLLGTSDRKQYRRRRRYLTE